jgi:hypothetical protein
MMNFTKQDAYAFLIYLALVAVIRHTIVLTRLYMNKEKDQEILKRYFELIKYQNIISAGDIAAAILYVVLIKKCCMKDMTKAFITSFIIYYLVAMYAMGNEAETKSFSTVFSLDTQKETLINIAAPVLAAVIACRCC